MITAVDYVAIETNYFKLIITVMKTTKLFTLLMALAVMTFAFTSCKDDDPVLVIDEGLPVADGFYFAKVGEDLVATSTALKSSMVDAPGFGAMSRDGFKQAYVYLTAGSYNLLEVVGKEVANTYGGAATLVTGDDDANKECDESGYSLVTAAVDGDAFSIGTDGLYVIAYDATSSEIVYDKITSAGIIGAATPGGWGADTELNTSATIAAEGATWTLEGVTIDVGEMKFRFNCRWAIDRRLDRTVDFDNANGYSFFTNFGGSVDALLAGNEGANIQNDEYAVYTVTMSWDPVNGFTATKTKTGEAEPKPEYPAELHMIGDGVGGWDWAANGIQMNPVHSNPHLFWRIVWLEASLGVKFAPVADWIGDFGSTGTATNGVYAKGTDNVPTPAAAGYYMVVVNLETGAETVEINEPLVYGIGDAFGGWDAATTAYLFTVDNANGVITSSAFVADANLRMHTTASTFTPVGAGPAVEWWQAEFNVIGGNIEYRATGGDQVAVAVTTGQTVSLNFQDGTGTIQ